MLQYIGYVNPNDPAERDALHGVPARDLTEEEVAEYDRAELLASGLYRDRAVRAHAEEMPTKLADSEKAKTKT